ncbi:NAD(P)-dependent oxidoreductase [Actibacterium lipolyticum]|uniref:3-hydroxyisobutyrate dehydrogenase n=1 Tax=Actibacterium lipolyticum TaxID=1524263 RepID=A0A238KMT9_9RHOB|nr:NAD(P)-binding domain-containing protein [Actibacterium lipolyticum]SMX44028.1 3-hydroxyisobutyrate dehydrogenase [Actibacterium lipolyticum]
MGKHVRQRRNDRPLTFSGIGVAGCGRMGRPMLRALREAGHDARGFDIRPRSEYGALSSVMHNDPETFADGLRILLTVVRDMHQTDDMLFGEYGLVKRAKQLEMIVVCSTLSPRYTRDLRARTPVHVKLIDAPMSGAQIKAERKELSFMLGGDAADLDFLQPLFATMGTHFHRMGGFGSGMEAKVLNNLLAASSTAMTRLVLDWADKTGVDEKELLALIHTSSGQNWLASGFDEIEFARDGYSEDNTIGILVKDVESALDAAPDGADTSLPRVVQNMIRHLKPRP